MEGFRNEYAATTLPEMRASSPRPTSDTQPPTPFFIVDTAVVRMQQATAQYHSASPLPLSPMPSRSQVAPTLPHHSKQDSYGQDRKTKVKLDPSFELQRLSYSTDATAPPSYAPTTSVTFTNTRLGLPTNPRPVYGATLEPPPSFPHRTAVSMNVLPSYSTSQCTLVHKKSQSVGDPTHRERSVSPFERTSLKPPRIPSSVFSSFQSSSRRNRTQGALSIHSMHWNRIHTTTSASNSEPPPPLPSFPGPQSRTYRYLKERTLI